VPVPVFQQAGRPQDRSRENPRAASPS
jgi:hypothetical protein